jgi:hypothetical protein
MPVTGRMAVEASIKPPPRLLTTSLVEAILFPSLVARSDAYRRISADRTAEILVSLDTNSVFANFTRSKSQA